VANTTKINRLREKAFSLQDSGRLEEALEAYEDLVRNAPDEIGSIHRMGDICRRLDRKEDAVAHYKTVVEHYAADGLVLKAISVCKEIIAFYPHHRAGNKLLKHLHFLQKNVRKSQFPKSLPPQMSTKPKMSLKSVLKQSSATIPAAPSLPATPLFSDLPRNAFLKFVQGMQARTLNQGDVIVRERETGHSFFVIVSGRVRVEKRVGKKRTTLAFLSDGAFFGEMAFIQKAPRTASVIVASEKCSFFEFDKKMIKKVISEHPSVERVMRRFCEERLLSTTMAVHPLFKAFHISVRRELMALFKSRTFARHDVLIEEGKVSKGLYLVLSGELAVRAASGNKDRELARLSPGDMFGEMSILSKSPAAATVLTLKETRVLRLPASSFMKVAKVYPDVLDLLDSLAHERRSANQFRLTCPLPISEEEGQAMV